MGTSAHTARSARLGNSFPTPDTNESYKTKPRQTLQPNAGNNPRHAVARKVYEDRHHLLSHLRRQRRRRHRTRHRTRRPRPRDPLHHLLATLPPDRPRSRTSTSTKSPSPTIPSSNTRPTISPSPPAWPKSPSFIRSICSTSTTPFRTRSAPCSPARCSPRAASPPALHHHPPRHRHHPGRPRPLLPAHHQVRHRAESDGVTAISTYLRNRTREAFNIDSEIEVIRNFVNCDVYRPQPRARRRHASPLRRTQRAPPRSPLQLPPRQTRHDVVEVFARVAKAMPARLC